MKINILISCSVLAVMQMALLLPMAKAADDGREWLKSAPAFCRSEPYSSLTPRQMSKCDEAAFRYMSKNWKTITASNGQAYEIALDTIIRPLPENYDRGAALRAASVVVYISEGDTFNPDNVTHFYFDCLDRFQTFSSRWSPAAYAPPKSIAAKISSVACKHSILRANQVKPHSENNDKSYDPIPPAWNRAIGLPGTLNVGVLYCTQSGQCKTVGDNINLAGFTIGGAPADFIQGCRSMPNAEPCLKARMPVEVLASSPTGSVIVKIDGKNYALGNFGNGVEVSYKGVNMTLREYLQHYSQ